MSKEGEQSTAFQQGSRATRRVAQTLWKASRTIGQGRRLLQHPGILALLSILALLTLAVLDVATLISTLFWNTDPLATYELERDAIEAWIDDDYESACQSAGGCRFTRSEIAGTIYFDFLTKDVTLTRFQTQYGIAAESYTDAAVGDSEAFAKWITANAKSFFRVQDGEVILQLSAYRSQDQWVAIHAIQAQEHSTLWEAYRMVQNLQTDVKEINRELLQSYSIAIAEVEEAKISGFTQSSQERPLFDGAVVNWFSTPNWAGSEPTGTYADAYLYWNTVIYPTMQEHGLLTYGSYQCTDFAHYRFWLYYGFDCKGGNGNQMAANTANAMEEFQLVTVKTPEELAEVKAGSLFSSTTTNHVGFIEAVNPEQQTITFSDGNYGAGGLRFNNTVSFEQFFYHWGGQFAVPVVEEGMEDDGFLSEGA